MRVKFTEDANTMDYGKVKAGETITVSKPDGEAFITSKKAVKAKAEKKEAE